ncbi:hypothetical protein AMECASPLE_016646 [Ameca splendens]|uniref:Uncharacterized protein n=1 Tax=Ameca splendens TaxID=208324 RepID=A0ABV0ZPR0_9TELE
MAVPLVTRDFLEFPESCPYQTCHHHLSPELSAGLFFALRPDHSHQSCAVSCSSHFPNSQTSALFLSHSTLHFLLNRGFNSYIGAAQTFSYSIYFIYSLKLLLKLHPFYSYTTQHYLFHI